MEFITRTATKRFCHELVSGYFNHFEVMNPGTSRESLSFKDRSLLDFANNTIHAYSDTQELTLYRSVKDEMIFNSDHIYSSDAILCTTLFEGYSKYYGIHTLIIHCPKGTSKILTDEEGVRISEFTDIGEYLLPSGSQLKLVHIEKSGNGYLYHCKLLPNRPPKVASIKLRDLFETIYFLQKANNKGEYDIDHLRDLIDYTCLMKSFYFVVNNSDGFSFSILDPDEMYRVNGYKYAFNFNPFELFDPKSIAQKALE